MSSGERGPVGDHGQAGDIGPTGPTGPTGKQGNPGVAPWVIRKATTAYCVLALGVLGGVGYTYNTQRNSDRHICEALEDNRSILRDLINRTGQTLAAPPDASDELKNILEQSRKSGEDFRRYAASRLVPLDC